jgi:thioredoxin 1
MSSSEQNGKIIQVESSQHFSDLIENDTTDKIYIVDFYADWCGPCKVLGEVMNELSEKYSDKNIQFTKVNTDNNRELSQRFSIMSIPAVYFFQGGKMMDKDGSEGINFKGYRSKEYVENIIDSLL